MKFETKAIRLQTERSQHREHSVPLFATSSFVFEDAEQMRALFADEYEGNIYSRFSNPNAREFESKIAALEEVEDAHATASGMAAIFASFGALLKQGDHILTSKALFGSSMGVIKKVLPDYGISHTDVDPEKPETWEAEIRANTKMIFLETPSNPGLTLIDLEWVGNLAKKHGLIFNVDNCFATPYLQQPAKFGADLICHSATKFIDGQGRVIGGVVAGSKELVDTVRKFCRKTGPAISPFNAWVLSKSLETLAVRMDRHCENAFKLAEAMRDHPEILSVKYPFLPTHPQYQIAIKQMKMGGGIVTFEVKGGVERGRRFLDSLSMLSLSANLGDTRTIATHPSSSTHAKWTEEARRAVGIVPGLVRISVGLENIKDIIGDINQALERTKAVNSTHITAS